MRRALEAGTNLAIEIVGSETSAPRGLVAVAPDVTVKPGVLLGVFKSPARSPEVSSSPCGNNSGDLVDELSTLSLTGRGTNHLGLRAILAITFFAVSARVDRSDGHRDVECQH